jgi:hypothetical protein
LATLRSLTIENFKAIKDPVKIEFKPITLLFGPNSAGKSTIIQALIYAREIFVYRNLDPYQCEVRGERIDLGGFRALVHNHEPVPIILELELDLMGEELPWYTHDDQLRDQLEDCFGNYLNCLKGAHTVSVRVSIRWDDKVSRPFVESYRTAINGEVFSEITDLDTSQRSITSRINLSQCLFSIKYKECLISRLDIMADSKLEKPERYQWTTDAPKPLQSCLNTGKKVLPDWDSQIEFAGGFKESENSDLYISDDWKIAKGFDELLSRAVVGPGKLVRDCLKDFRHLGPLRAIPPRILEQSQLSQETGVRSGFSIWEELFSVDEEILVAINDWVRGTERLNTGYEIDRKSFRELDSKRMADFQAAQISDRDKIIDEISTLPERIRVSLRQTDTQQELSFRDVGTGISQVLPVVIASMIARNQIVAIEQPELHIHPALQVKLGDLFISRIKDSGCLFLLETHSEHLILRMLRRIRETSENTLQNPALSLKPDQLNVIYIEPKSGNVRVLPLRIDETGEFIDRWPSGFFSERVKELYGE